MAIHKTTPRRKKTNADIKNDRLARERAREVYQKQQKDLCWDDCMKLHRRCEDAFTIVDPVIAILRSPDVMNNLGDKRTTVKQLANGIIRDMKLFRERLNDVLVKHQGKTGGENDASLLMQALVIGEEYRQWLDSFQTVIAGAVGDILNIVEDAANAYLATKQPEPLTA